MAFRRSGDWGRSPLRIAAAETIMNISTDPAFSHVGRPDHGKKEATSRLAMIPEMPKIESVVGRSRKDFRRAHTLYVKTHMNNDGGNIYTFNFSLAFSL